jgi:ribokinase
VDDSGPQGRVVVLGIFAADLAFRARRGLEIARRHGVPTILNPAPAAPLADEVYRLCGYLTPNETEASALAGIAVEDLDSARRAGDRLLARGVGCALITLGDKAPCCTGATARS